MNNDFYITFKDGTNKEQIEKACLILYGIFGVFFQPDSIEEKGQEFQETVEIFSQIGVAFVDSIYKNISEIENENQSTPTN